MPWIEDEVFDSIMEQLDYLTRKVELIESNVDVAYDMIEDHREQFMMMEEKISYVNHLAASNFRKHLIWHACDDGEIGLTHYLVEDICDIVDDCKECANYDECEYRKVKNDKKRRKNDGRI